MLDLNKPFDAKAYLNHRGLDNKRAGILKKHFGYKPGTGFSAFGEEIKALSPDEYNVLAAQAQQEMEPIDLDTVVTA